MRCRKSSLETQFLSCKQKIYFSDPQQNPTPTYKQKQLAPNPSVLVALQGYFVDLQDVFEPDSILINKKTNL